MLNSPHAWNPQQVTFSNQSRSFKDEIEHHYNISAMTNRRNDETHIIIKRDGKYYNNNLNFDNELKFTEEDINLKEDLLYALEEEDIDIININCNKLNIDTHKLSTNIHDNIKKIKQNNKLENKFEQTRSNKNKKYYLNKNYRTHSLNNLVKIKEILSWYKETIQESMDGTNNDAIKDIYNFLHP